MANSIINFMSFIKIDRKEVINIIINLKIIIIILIIIMQINLYFIIIIFLFLIIIINSTKLTLIFNS